MATIPFNEVNEEVVTNALLDCMLLDNYPNKEKKMNFSIWELDYAAKTVFLVCSEDFTDEERFFISDYLRTNVYRKLVIGIIRSDKLLEVRSRKTS